MGMDIIKQKNDNSQTISPPTKLFFCVVVVKPLKPCWLICSLTVSKIREIPCSIYSTAQQYSVVAMVIIILTKP